MASGTRELPLTAEARRVRAPAAALLAGAGALLPGAVTAHFAYNGGGYFPGVPALVAILLVLVLVWRFALVGEPLGRLGAGLAVATGLLVLFAAWSLASSSWAQAGSRPLIEADRALLYALGLLVVGLVAGTVGRLEWALRGLALALVAVAVTGLATRVLPARFPIALNVADERLSYPVTYWNALGMLAALGTTVCVHLAAGGRAGALVRVLSAAAIPALATTIYFTFSRGAIAAVVVGIVAYVALARPRMLPSAVLAAGPPAAIALVVAYHAGRLASPQATTPAAVAQGHHVAVALAACTVAAGMLRLALLRLDPRLVSLRVPLAARPRAVALVAAVAIAAVAGGAVAAGAPGYVSRQYHAFLDGSGATRDPGDFRSRLTDPSNAGRLDFWKVALDGFGAQPLRGHGAGTFAFAWSRDRPSVRDAQDAHSLYLQTLDETGLVGFLLLVGAILVMLLGVLRRVRGRGPERATFACAFAIALAWALHAQIDWDWQMPAVTFPVFAVGGAALAAGRAGPGRPRAAATSGVRALGIAACAGVVVLPVLLALSQARLDAASTALRRGDCAAATHQAHRSLAVLGSRPEPYDVLARCASRGGRPAVAVAQRARAAATEPGNWLLYLELALDRAAAGLDPRAAARRSLVLNPRHAWSRLAAATFRGTSPAAWRSQARRVSAVVERHY